MPKFGDGAERKNENKIRLDLVPPSLMFAVGQVFTEGAKKYAERNWEKGMPYSVVVGSLQRHLFKWLSPFHSDFDSETGLSHLWHVACNVAMLIEYEFSHPKLDDRPKLDYNLLTEKGKK